MQLSDLYYSIHDKNYTKKQKRFKELLSTLSNDIDVDNLDTDDKPDVADEQPLKKNFRFVVLASGTNCKGDYINKTHILYNLEDYMYFIRELNRFNESLYYYTNEKSIPLSTDFKSKNRHDGELCYNINLANLLEATWLDDYKFIEKFYQRYFSNFEEDKRIFILKTFKIYQIAQEADIHLIYGYNDSSYTLLENEIQYCIEN